MCERDHFLEDGRDMNEWKGRRIVELGLYKQHIRELLNVLWKGSPVMTTWSFIDRCDSYMRSSGGMDVSYVQDTGYRPLPPEGFFYAGCFRSCDPYLPDFEEQVLPMFAPGAVLVFDWLNRSRPEDGGNDNLNRDSQVFRLVKEGKLIPLLLTSTEEDDRPNAVLLVGGHDFDPQTLERAAATVHAFSPSPCGREG
jgi:hypothetical protein